MAMDDHFKEADEALGLTPQEGALYQRHLTNLWGPGGVDNKDEAGNVVSRSTLYQSPQQGPDGRWYNIPTVWNGKKEVEPYVKPSGETMDVPNAKAMQNVERTGWDKFPAYNSPDEADARYEQMHKFMEQDTGDYLNAQRNKPAPTEPAAIPPAAAPVPRSGDYVNRLFQIESGGNPSAVTGSNRGLGQFGPTEEHMYGITDANRNSPQAQAAAVMRERAVNDPSLARVLGRDPTDAEHYLAHQQGLAGASALLSNPNVPAWQAIRPYYRSDAIAQRAIMGNVPGDSPLKRLDVNSISSAGFTSMWRDKFNRGLGVQNERRSGSMYDQANYAAYEDPEAPPPTAFMRAGKYIKVGEPSSGPSKNVEDRRDDAGPLTFPSQRYLDLHKFIGRVRDALDDPELSNAAGLPDVDEAIKSDNYRRTLDQLTEHAKKLGNLPAFPGVPSMTKAARSNL